MRMKRIMMLAVCVASLAVLAGEYDDYVKYTGSGIVAAFDNGAYWDDNGNPPGPGKNYYIGKSYYYGWNGETGKTFQGDKLVVADTFFFGGTADTTVGFGDTEWIAGSKIFYYTPLQITAGKWTVSTTVDKPLKIEYSRSDAPYDRTYPQDFASAADGYAVMVKRSDSPNDTKGLNVSATGDWSQYYGTFEMGFVHTFKRPSASGAFVCPGTLKFRENTALVLESSTVTHEVGSLDAAGNASLSVYGALNSAGTVLLRGASALTFKSTDKTHAVGTLDLGAESVLTIPSGSSVTVSDRLLVEDGATLKHTLQTKSTTDYDPAPVLLLTLSKTAYEAGLPDLSKIQLVSTASGCTSNGPYPRVYLKVEETDDGGAKIFVAQRKIVEHITQDLGGGTSLNKAANWSDNALPGPSNDYYCAVYGGKGAQINFLNESDKVVWAGGTLFMDSEWAPVMLTAHDVTIADLWLSNKAYVRPMGVFGQIYDLRGKLSVPAGGKGRLQMGDGDTLRLHSDLGGSGLLNIKYGGENNTKAEYLYGILELSGDNRNFAGKFYLSMEGHARWPIVVPSATVNVTAKVFDGFGFGGELAAFTYDALTVTNFCRVTVMDDADFTPVTRGWYLTDEKAFVKVEDGKTAKLRSVLTLNDNTTMVKEGAGAFWIYQTPSVRGTGAATVNVSAGVLGAGSANAFDGLSLTFADGALAVPALGGEGIDLTNVASIGGTGLKVKIDMTGIAEKSGDYAVPVLKFPKGTAYATRFAQGSGNLSVTLMNRTRGYCVKGLRYEDDGENITVTAGLTVGGFLLFLE